MNKETNSILERKRAEIESLKADLENLFKKQTTNKPTLNEIRKTNTETPVLINNNINSTKIKQSTENKTQESRTNCKPETNNLNLNKGVPALANENPKRRRGYNVEETRDYIRKQREKRANEGPTKTSSDKTHREITKQKLRELHERAQELARQNLEIKARRERSRSRNRNDEVRLDNISKNAPTPPRSTKSSILSRKPREKSRETRKTNPKNSLETVPPKSESNFNTKNPQNSNNHQEKELEIESQNHLAQNTPVIPPTAEIPQNNQNPLNHIASNLTNEKEPIKKEAKETQTSQNYIQTEWLFRSGGTHNMPSNPYNFINTVKRKIQMAENTANIARPHASQHAGNTSKDEGYSALQQPKSSEEIKALLLKSINLSSKEERETPKQPDANRTFEEFDEQKRRKEEERRDNKKVETLNEEKNGKVDEKLKSVDKDLNLDLNRVDQMELIYDYSRDKFGSTGAIPKRRLFPDADASGSDTSNNIPEITSESFGAPEQDCSVTELSLVNVKKLKLTTTPGIASAATTPSTSTTSIHTTIGMDLNVLKSATPPTVYSSDFQSTNQKTANKVCNVLSSTAKSGEFLDNETSDTNFKSKEFHSLLHQSSAKTNNSLNKTRNITTRDSWQLDDGGFGRSSEKPPLKKQPPAFSTFAPPTTLSAKHRDNSVIGKKDLIGTRDSNCASKTFEAEQRLVDDFNQSLRQFMATEEAYENLKRNHVVTIKCKTSSLSSMSSLSSTTSMSLSTSSSVNCNRGSDFYVKESKALGGEGGGGATKMSKDCASALAHSNNNNNNTTAIFSEDSFSLGRLNLSNFNDSFTTTLNDDESLSINESAVVEGGGELGAAERPEIFLKMYDDLIKTEELSIENLKLSLKARKQSLMQRTQTELSCLQIQKNDFLKTGKIEEASLVKKKQRGILLKLAQESNEIKKLKQMQAAAFRERKNLLKKERNLIKNHLSTENMLAQIKSAVSTNASNSNGQRERRNSGPLRVVQSQELSTMAKKETTAQSSNRQENKNQCEGELKSMILKNMSTMSCNADIDNLKRALLMKETALQERRKEVEELLEWHRKLVDEEREITNLVAAASSELKMSIPPKLPTPPPPQPTATTTTTTSEVSSSSSSVENSEVKLSEKETKVVTEMHQNCDENRGGEVEGGEDEGEAETVEEEEYSSHFEPENSEHVSIIAELIEGLSDCDGYLKSTESKTGDVAEVLEEQQSKESVDSSKTENIETVISGASSSSPQSSKTSINSEESTDEKTRTTKTSKEEEEISVQNNGVNSVVSGVESEKSSGHSFQSLEHRLAISGENSSVSTLIAENCDKSDSKLDSVSEDCLNLDVISLDKDSDHSNRVSNEEVLAECKSDVEISNHNSTVETIESVDDLSNDKCSLRIEEEILTNGFCEENEEFNCSNNNNDDDNTINSVYNKLSDDSSEKCNNSVIVNGVDEDTNNNNIDNNSNSCSTISSGKESVEDNVADLNEENKKIEKNEEIGVEKENEEEEEKGGIQEAVHCVQIALKPQIEGNHKFDDEAEELFRKQLAIEQEIKQLERQVPYVYMREIPNKPPPPYTPPSYSTVMQRSILPTDPKEIDDVTKYTSKVLFKAYQTSNLDKVKFSESSFKLVSTLNIGKDTCQFLFDLSKEVALEYFNQYGDGDGVPSNVSSTSFMSNMPSSCSKLARNFCAGNAKKGLIDGVQLEKYLNVKLRELCGFKKVSMTERVMLKWANKRRDHVDEVLMVELQKDQVEWTNFERDELLIKNELCQDIFKMLIDDTVGVFQKNLLARNTKC